MRNRFIVAVVAFLLSVSGLAADAVRLSGGQVIEGKIIEEREDVIIFESEVGTYSFERRDILEIEKEEGDYRIARLPEPEVSPYVGAAYSFIPGYSGLYMTRRPELGIPLSMINLYYLVSAYDHLSLRQKVDFFDSNYYKEWFLFGDPFKTVYTQRVFSTRSEGLFDFGPAWREQAFVHYLNYQAGKKEYELALGGTITKNEMSRKGNNYLRLWFAYSTLNAALSYATLEFQPSFIVDAGPAQDERSSGTTVSIYALATPTREADGLNLGMMLVF